MEDRILYNIEDLKKILGSASSLFVLYDKNVEAFAKKIVNKIENISEGNFENRLESKSENKSESKSESKSDAKSEGDSESKGLKVRSMKSFEAKESNKNMSSVLEIEEWLLNNGADRSSFLLAIGGGITTDISGFAASIYRRGIKFGLIPTTLLSQVDAAIGGKTGVNFMELKNMLGAIVRPEFTYISSEPLKTLSKHEFISGSAELFKTFIIENEVVPDEIVDMLITLCENESEGEKSEMHNYELAVKFIPIYIRYIFDGDLEYDLRNILEEKLEEKSGEKSENEKVIALLDEILQYLIYSAAKVKAGIVARDRYEQGERKKLNLGHTFGHAIESLYFKNIETRIPEGEAEEKNEEGKEGIIEENFGKEEKIKKEEKEEKQKGKEGITHGEAVAIGMVMAAKLSEIIFSETAKENTGETEQILEEEIRKELREYISGGEKESEKGSEKESENGSEKESETAKESEKEEGGLAERLRKDLRLPEFEKLLPFPIAELEEAMKKDKKAKGNVIEFVLIKEIGNVVLKKMTASEAIALLQNN